VCESFAVNFGVANTFGPTINGRASDPYGPDAESFKTYMGSFTFTAPTNAGVLAGSTLTGGIISGYNSALGDETSYYAGVALATPITGVKVGAAFDYMDVHNTSGETYVLGGYVAWQATEKLAFFGRGEYLRDRGDQKIFLKSVTDPTDATATILVPSAPDRVLELTGTVQYDLWKNVLSRLEIRWDHSLSGEGVWGETDPDTGFGTLQNQVMIAANIVYKF